MSSAATIKTLREAGVSNREAIAHGEAVETAIEEATRNLVTQDSLRATLYRALLIQGAAIIGAVVALLRLLPAPSG